MNQPGLRARIIVAILVFLTLGFGIGFFYIQSQPALYNQLIVALGGKNPDDQTFAFIQEPEIRKHFEAQVQQKKYRVVTVSSGKGTTTTTEIDQSGDTTITHITEATPQKKLSEIYSTDKELYVLDIPTNSWWKAPILQPPSATIQDVTKIVAAETDRKTLAEQYLTKKNFQYTNMGTEPCGNLNCYTFQELFPENPGADRTFWFDTIDYLLRKEELHFGEFVTTSEYSYDVTIALPERAKDVPPGKSIYDFIALPTP